MMISQLNMTNLSSLILAVKAGDVAMIEKLLYRGSEIEATDRDGRT